MVPNPSIEVLLPLLWAANEHTLHMLAYFRKTVLLVHKSLGNQVVSVLADSGNLIHAQKTFDKLDFRNQSAWNSLINAYVKFGQLRLAVKLYHKMRDDSIHPTEYTCVALLKACTKLNDVNTGFMLHSHMANTGLIMKNIFIGTALIDMYCKFGMLEKARDILTKLPVRDVVTWTSLAAGYVHHEQGYKALNCFHQMRKDGFSPNSYSFMCALKACGMIKNSSLGREIHDEIIKLGLLSGNLVLGNALVDMYAKCGCLEKAKDVFENLDVRDAITWTALISGYAQHEKGEEALNCYSQMLRDGVFPNAITLASCLKACGIAGAIDKGMDIHKFISKKGMLKKDAVLGTALVDMYVKCGLLSKAEDVFDNMEVRDMIAWNSLITGYAQRGDFEEALCAFESMRKEHCKPNSVTFLSVLNACSHAGLLDKGQTYFELMTNGYGITSTLEHHCCMVDLFGRAGQLDRAIATMKESSYHPNVMLWLTVLSACQKWCDLELGKYAFEEVVKLDEKESKAYICMSNIYADANMQEDAMRIEAMKVEKQA